MRPVPVLIALAALAALAYACWPAPEMAPAVLTPASAGRSLSSYFNLDASPDDAYAAYKLLDDCIVFQMTPGSTNSYQDSYWHWLRDALTAQQQAAAMNKANAIAAKFRQHAGLPAHG